MAGDFALAPFGARPASVVVFSEAVRASLHTGVLHEWVTVRKWTRLGMVRMHDAAPPVGLVLVEVLSARRAAQRELAA
jgi:hypothetical protein